MESNTIDTTQTEHGLKPDYSEFISDPRAVRRTLVLPANPEFWEAMKIEMPEGAKAIMAEQQIIDVIDKHEDVGYKTTGIFEAMSPIVSMGYTAKDDDPSPVEIDEEEDRAPSKQVEAKGGRDSLFANKLLAIAAMAAGMSSLAGRSPLIDFSGPINAGYKAPKSYSPGPSTRGNKNVNFTKKKQAAKIAAKSKRANRK